jgi:hypothetical protein
MIHPVKGRLTMVPAGRANRIKPNVPSLKWRFVLMVGILLAQLAKLNPLIKKKQAIAIRWAFFDTILLLMEPQR